MELLFRDFRSEKEGDRRLEELMVDISVVAYVDAANFTYKSSLGNAYI